MTTMQRPTMAWAGARSVCLLVAAAAMWGMPATGRGQLCTTSHQTDLYCLLPATFHTSAAPFNAFFTPFGTELSELPTARPAGLVLAFDHGLLVPTTENLGAVFTERAESLGRRRVFLGFNYQNFTFGSIDGTSLRNLPIVLFYPPGQVYTAVKTRLDVRVGQYTFVAAAGVTRRMDVSVSVPVERIAFSAEVTGNEYIPFGGSAPVQEQVPGHSSGIADVVVGAKYLVSDRRNTRFTVGTDVRLPTGDELNFLGSGTVGVRPYLALSRKGRVSPHVNTGYQWNGNSILNANGNGDKQRLPTNFFYTAGATYEVSHHVTLTSDVLGRYFYNSPRLAKASAVTIPTVGTSSSVQPYAGSFVTTDLSLGAKSQFGGRLLLTGNVTLQLDHGGLRARAVPLVGAAYSF